MEKKKTAMLAALFATLIACVAIIGIAVVMLLPGNSASTGTPNDPTDTTTNGSTAPPSDPDLEDNMIDPSQLTAAIADRLYANDKTHGLTLNSTAVGTLNAATGTISEDYTVLHFDGKQASAEWTMDWSRPIPENGDDPILLAVTEIHRENEETLAYTVYVDGKAVYFRTYRQIASAPNTYYIWLNRADIDDLSQVTVRIESASKSDFAIASVAAYTDFYGALEREGLETAVKVYLHSAASLDLARQHVEDFAGYDYDLYRMGLLFKSDYMNSTVDAAVGTITEQLALAAKHNMNVQFMPTIYWGQPNVADGQGGLFTDAKYQQVSYSSQTGRYYPSIPNVYGSTTWVTSGSTVLNQACAAKLTQIFSRMQSLLAQYRAGGLYDGLAAIVMEHGVCYKALGTSTDIPHNELDGGDFNPGMILMAKADGVTLDPTDGLSREEKMWMIKHHADYNQNLATAYQKALGSEAILVSKDGVVYPTYQLSDHILTHGVQWVERHPSNDDMLISGWKSGVGYGMYSSSEDMYWDDVRFYQYKASYGRVGTVNFEVTYSRSRDLYDLMRKAYELGFEYMTLFNDKSEFNTSGILKSLDSIDEEAATYSTVHYDRPLLDANFNRDTTVSDWATRYDVVSMEGVTFDAANGYLKPTGNESGTILFRITDGGDAFAHGLRLFTETKGTVVVSAGPAPDRLAACGTCKPSGGSNYVNSYNGTEFNALKDSKGQTEYYVKVTLAVGAKLKSVEVYSLFGETTGQLNDVSTLTRRDMRLTALWIQNERLANNMLDRYLAKNGGSEDTTTAAARELMDKGLYVTAYQYLSQAVSKVLPATFSVNAEGTLGTLPIDAVVGNQKIAQITIHSLSNHSAEMSFSSNYQFSEFARKVTLTFRDLEEGNYSLTKVAFNRYQLKKDSAGTLAVENGSLSFTVTVDYGTEIVKKETISGRVVSKNGNLVYLLVQDPAISQYSSSMPFELAAGCELLRSADRSSETEEASPQNGDYVVLTMNEEGKAVKCVSTYGLVTAKVTAYTAPDYTDIHTENARITLDNGQVYELEYLAYTTRIVDGDSAAAAKTFTDEALKALLVGKTVDVKYCPEYYGEYQRVLQITIKE
ncbi:MAG: hypothetical protein E7618_01825 [Ruminococcaceae bacterium]|nr:hypothetical protein [Oscillospiraceae bacterium]